MWSRKEEFVATPPIGERTVNEADPRPAATNRPAEPKPIGLNNRNSSIESALLNFFGLKKQPFGVTPDPSFLYLSRTHREAVASLIYGIEAGRGFMALMARPGMGKTTLLFHLLERFRASARAAFLFQTQCTSREFMQSLVSELGCPTTDQDFVRINEEFNDHLLRNARAGKRFVVIIDEAQNLDPSVLETVRLLSNFETPQAKLLQIVLSGQPELAEKLSRPEMVQLRQRVASLNQLEPLSKDETEQYIQHRMRISGYQGKSILTSEALAELVQFADGTPRNINNFCFNAMSLAFALDSRVIDKSIAQEVIKDLDITRHFECPSSAPEAGILPQTAKPNAGKADDLVAQTSANADASPAQAPDADVVIVPQVPAEPITAIAAAESVVVSLAPINIEENIVNEEVIPAQLSSLPPEPLNTVAAKPSSAAETVTEIKSQDVVQFAKLDRSLDIGKQHPHCTNVVFDALAVIKKTDSVQAHASLESCEREESRSSGIDPELAEITKRKFGNVSVKSTEPKVSDLATTNRSERNMTLAESVAYMNELTRSLKTVRS